jgi:hypothetical protein
MFLIALSVSFLSPIFPAGLTGEQAAATSAGIAGILIVGAPSGSAISPAVAGGLSVGTLWLLHGSESTTAYIAPVIALAGGSTLGYLLKQTKGSGSWWTLANGIGHTACGWYAAIASTPLERCTAMLGSLSIIALQRAGILKGWYAQGNPSDDASIETLNTSILPPAGFGLGYTLGLLTQASITGVS